MLTKWYGAEIADAFGDWSPMEFLHISDKILITTCPSTGTRISAVLDGRRQSSRESNEGGAPAYTDLERMELALPDDRKVAGHIDIQTRQTLLKHFPGQLANVSTPEDAVVVLELAVNFPHSATRLEYANAADVILDGPLDVTAYSLKTMIFRAFQKSTGAACVIKFATDDELDREASVYSAVSASGLNFVPNEIVSISPRKCALGGIINKSRGLRMPMYTCSLSSVPAGQLPEHVVLGRMVEDIVPALEHLHSVNIFHMDVKLANILLGYDGRWYLSDFGSCVRQEGDQYRVTYAKKPQDLKLKAGARFDMVLLAVACLELALGFPSKRAAFTLRDLERAVADNLVEGEFKRLVRTLMATA